MTPRLKDLAILYKRLGDLGDDLENFHHNSEKVLEMMVQQVEEQIELEGGEITDDLEVIASTQEKS